MSASSPSVSEARTAVAIESIAAGDALPVLDYAIDRRALIRFAGAVDDYSEPHWDHLYMVQRDLPGVIVHGWLSVSVLMRMIAGWFPVAAADYREFSIRYVRPNMPGRALYGGTIREIAGRSITIDLWIDNPEGQRLAEAMARIELA